jgi:hypothetical protein
MTDRATAVGTLSSTSRQERGLRSDRKSAISVGVLWIMATVFPVMSISAWSSLEDGGGILANAATHESQMITWALLNLVGAVAAAGVAFMFYPILKRAVDTSVKQGLALWYVGTRITESGCYLVAVLATWAFLPLSREFAAAGAPDVSHFQTSGLMLQTTQDLALALAQSVFAVGAGMLYYLLFQTRLVPRWLSLWGLLSAPLFLIASLSLLWTGDPNSTLANIFFAPLALQEMVLAVWLIFKGFDTAALAFGPARVRAIPPASE